MHVQKGRVTGILDVLADAGIDHPDVPVVERHLNNPETAREAAAELLENNPGLTAVVCTTDSQALGVLDYAEINGLDVPGGLSVVGFDGIPRARARGLSTVEQPNREKGFTSGNVLAALIGRNSETTRRSEARGAATMQWAEPEPRIILPTRYLPGATVGPAPR